MPVHGIEIDHGPMPANDALTFIIRASPAQGRDILAASHHLFRRDTRESLLGHDAFKHIRRRCAARDGSCSGGRTDSGKGQSIRNAHRRGDVRQSDACAGRWPGSPGPAYPASVIPQAAPAHAPVPRVWRNAPPRSADPGHPLPGGLLDSAGRRFFPVHPAFLLALGADMAAWPGCNEGTATTTATDRTK